MVFNSYIFLIFFPIVVIIYHFLPQKIRPYWLLIASYYFYMSWNAKYAILILFSTAATYVTAILIDGCRKKYADDEKKRKTVSRVLVGAVLTVNLGLLFFFKYYNFFFSNLSRLFSSFGIELKVPVFDVILPVGISFYTFQALGYCIDVYRGEISAERNFFQYALFVSFFPQLVAGPIERSGNLLNQLSNLKPVSYDGLRNGVFLMLWGFFQKIVIADRIAIFVDAVYGNYSAYPGTYLVLASILFAFQIYCDFGGYSNIAKGAAKILGIELMNNFESPYLSTSCGKFWRRWHISLSSWFRDYVYIPLGGNRKGKARKYLNLMIVFGLSGLWHGANWTYVIWGLLNGIFQIIGDITKKGRDSLSKHMHINRQSFGTAIAKILITFCLIDFAWIFFRAENIHDAAAIIKNMSTVFNPWILFDGGLYQCGLTEKGFKLLGAAMLVLAGVDIANIKGIKIRDVILAQDYWFRAIAFAVSVCVILVFGIWGPGYESDAFLYFQF